MSPVMTEDLRKNATDNEVSRFQRQWGTYKAFCQDVLIDGEPIHKTAAQAWRLRNRIPPEYDWLIAERAHKAGFYRTHYAALAALNELPGRMRRDGEGDGQ